MNSLTQYIMENDLEHDRALNALQGKGRIISDNAVTSEEVSERDCAAAVEALPNIYYEPSHS